MYGLTRRAHSAGSHAGSFVTNWLTKAVWRLFDSAGTLSPLVRSGATTMGWLYDALGVLRPRTHNLVRNSSMQGARAGVPGTLPDNWSLSLAGLTHTVVSVFTESDMVVVRLRIQGTATGSSGGIRPEQSNSLIAASQGQTFTFSAFTRFVGAPVGLISLNMNVFGFAAGGAISEGTSGPDLISAAQGGGISDKRFSHGYQMASATTAFVRGQILFTHNIGASVDFTIDVAGPQLNLGDLQPFQRTGAYNLFRFTEDFSNAAWSKVGTTVSANATIGTDGGLNADKLVEDTSTGGHYVEQEATTAAANTHVIEWEIKAGERFRVNFEHYSIPTTSILANIQFNTQTGAFAGAISQNGAQLTPSAQQLANGWWRIRLVVTLGGTNTTIRARCAIINNGTTVYAGDGASGIFINRAQMHPGSVPMPYEPVLGATPTPTAFFGPRATYDPANLSSGPILAQRPSRTNNVRNNTMQGAVAGVPGTLPTNWAIAQPAGLTRTIALNTVGGISVIDITWSGTTTGAGAIAVQTDTNTGVPAASGQTWTGSAYVSVLQDSPAVTVLNMFLQGLTAAPAISESASSNFYASRANLYSRPRTTISLASGTTVNLRQQISTNAINSGVEINFTLRIGLPELSQGDILPWEPPILTFGAAATVGADLNTVRLADIGYNATESTIYADCFTSDRSVPRVVFDIGDGGAFGTTAYVTLTDAGTTLNPSVAPLNLVSTAATTSNSLKVAAALKRNDCVIAAGGLLGAVDTSCEVPSNPTTLTIGRGGWSGAANPLNGGVRQLAAIPTRVPNSGVQRLVRT